MPQVRVLLEPQARLVARIDPPVGLAEEPVGVAILQTNYDVGDVEPGQEVYVLLRCRVRQLIPAPLG